MNELRGKSFSAERALYASRDLRLVNCAFEGKEDGESALKECENIAAERCAFKLRYPLWHGENIVLTDCDMSGDCRAALWYTNNIFVKDCALLGIKCLRECRDANIINSRIVSPEFGWKCEKISLESCEVESEYAFLFSRCLRLKDVKFIGKYAFQYVEGAVIENCTLDTKDAFWHTQNVTVKNSTVNGEYLGWYSKNLTFENCKIIGTQPLCYCDGLKLVNCKMVDTDLSFEYSDVAADIAGDILSIKNPKSGKISAGGIGEIILTKDSKYPCKCEIIIKE